MTAVTVEASLVDEPDPTRSRFRSVREYLRKPLGVAAGVFLLLVVAAVSLAQVIVPYPPNEQDLGAALSTPSADHWLGTDRLGRDVLSRLLVGGQHSLLGLAQALGVALVLGVVLGLCAGYLGRVVDNVISRATEVIMAVPGIIAMLMVYALTDNNAAAGMVTVGINSAPTIVRVTRSAARSVRGEVFVAASEVIGMGRTKIMIKHILPNIWGPIIVNAAVLAAVILGVQGGLNYIGLGITPPDPSWGGMVSDAQQVLAQEPWLILPSGLLLTLVIMAFLLVADALRDTSSGNRSRPTTTAARRPDEPSGPALPVSETAVLSVRGLAVTFGELQVVKDVNFDLAGGGALAIVGESGCGKSVTASAVLGSLGRSATVTGHVQFDGVDLNHAPDRVRAAVRGTGIAYISQDPMVALDPCFTVAGQLGELVGRHDRIRGAQRRQRVLELLGQVGLPDPEDTARRYPHQLSGGMAQRVAIACALAGRPRVLVADEPTTALDVTIQGEILGLLRRLQEQTGMAIVLITHDLGVVADLCQSVAVMYAGEIVEFAEVQELFARPRHPYTRALLGANPMLAPRGERLPAIPGTVPAPGAWPSGCHFADRCSYTTDSCVSEAVGLTQVMEAEDHHVRCIRQHDIAAQLEGQLR
ncbi:ATP-binding cassette domain-containing protein [Nakamurella sp. YIM 132087]|uniref:ATP-binding cassette domain-containing protein n=1 Tax=Nakamurella alba TaxID=2665158 RepID=A0A7K1FE73_9ACTN|nr:dipeptide/oligopeptide/nickel ABC transporter permease/ATP-binding protein [Nakamurella alba]MTD12398.1 ATP-binding cassette domain-containing protein [Nakamurella alba]